MTRKKVKLAYITNDSARKATFKKRKKGLMKKVSELSTLCDISACAIIYSPYDVQPEVWPSPLGVQRVLSDFRMLPEMDQSKKMVNQEGFIRQRISKAADHLKRQRKDNREKEMTEVMFRCLVGSMGLNHLTIMDLNDLGWLIEQYLKDISRRSETLKKDTAHNSEATGAMPAAATVDVTTRLQDQAAGSNHPGQDMTAVDSMQRQQQWFMDLMNPQEQMGFGGEEMMFPFADNSDNTTTTTATNNNYNSLWSNGFFP